MKSVASIRCGMAVAVTVLMSIVSCSKRGDLTPAAVSFVKDGVTDTSVTYNNYIHDVLKNNCSTCHGTDGSAAHYWLNTNTYDNAVEYGNRIVETIVENSMPPAPRKPFSDTDKNLLKAWLKNGSPE